MHGAICRETLFGLLKNKTALCWIMAYRNVLFSTGYSHFSCTGAMLLDTYAVGLVFCCRQFRQEEKSPSALVNRASVGKRVAAWTVTLPAQTCRQWIRKTPCMIF